MRISNRTGLCGGGRAASTAMLRPGRIIAGKAYRPLPSVRRISQTSLLRRADIVDAFEASPSFVGDKAAVTDNLIRQVSKSDRLVGDSAQEFWTRQLIVRDPASYAGC